MYKTITTSEFLATHTINNNLPTFADIETDGLYINCSLIQLRQEGKYHMVTTNSEEEVEQMKEAMQDMHLVFYNASYDLGTLNFKVTPKVDDLFYLMKISYPSIQEFSLDKVVSYLGYTDLYKGLDKKSLQKAGFIRNAYLSQDQLRYAAADVEALERMWELDKVQKVREHVLAYRLGVYALQEAMVWQQNGLEVRQDTLKKYLADNEVGLRSSTLILEDLTYKGFNPRSPKQVKEILGTTSSDKATLTRIVINGRIEASKRSSTGRGLETPAKDFTEEEQSIAEAIMNVRKYKNALSKLTMYKHPSVVGRFNPLGAGTSRWTCKGGDLPNGVNLQNYSRDFKAIFGVASDSGKILVTADYSTLEVRIACAIMGDANMYKALMEGADIHKYTASLIFNKPIDEIDGRERSNSKVANFGFLYGMSANTFVGYAFDLYGLKLTLDEAKALRAKWMAAYPSVQAYHDKMGGGLRKNNLILETALGYRIRPKMYTDAINAATQGTGGECGRLAIHLMVKQDPRTLEVMANFLHDAFYLVVDEDEKDYWSELLSSCMVEAWKEISKSKLFIYKDIPMMADVATGYTLGDLVEGFEGGGQALSLTEMRDQLKNNEENKK